MKSILANALFSTCIVQFLCALVLGAKITYNTYPPVISRATPYKPGILAKSCLLKPDEGPCRADIRMHYFDPAKMVCSTFQWGGCQGNGNRFDTRQECLDHCISKPDEKKRRPKWCNLSFDYGFCFGALERWYYDHMWKVCKKTIYSGCGGNKNNFYSEEQCESVCRFGIGTIQRTTQAKGGMKKVIIINPWNTTPKRGRNQTARTLAPSTTASVKAKS